MTGKLYIIATPIGNLKDLTLRALEVLQQVEIVACEDTRVSKKLWDHYELKTQMISYHQHSTDSRVRQIMDWLKQGKEIGLITDAGTPGIADPGNKLIADILKELPDCQIIPVPGPSAVIAALSVSGFKTDRYTFFGFIPNKKGKQTMLRQIVDSQYTAVFYESCHRIMKTLNMLKELMPLGAQKQIVVTRELTKKFETIYRGTLDQVMDQLQVGATKGEFVVVVGAK